MIIIHDPQILQKELRATEQTVGLVPTMGALHEGHLTLVRESLRENDITVVSIFVNPTQFNQELDFEKYPSQVESDLKSLEELNVDIAFVPSTDEMYPDGHRYSVAENDFSKDLCGKDRPGHFEGVLTIVLKLISLTKASKAYFGKKDFQQYILIKEMVKDFFIDTEIIGIETVREIDGLAMSSRNLRLSSVARAKAPLLFKSLKSNKDLTQIKKEMEGHGFKIDYLEEIADRRFIAASIEDIRLIDNVRL